jgi:ankyrin repeat protein
MKILTIAIILLGTISAVFAAQDPASMGPRDKALIESAFKGQLAEVQVLVKKGASTEATDSKNRTALIWAAANGHTSVVEFLHSKGADINAKDSDGQTALMYAARKSSTPTVEFLLKNGAEVNVQSTKRGITALIIAAAVGDEELVRLLLGHGADKELAEIDGDTAVDHARQNGHATVVTLLENPPPPVSNS